MSYEDIKQTALNILSENYNLNLFSSSNREALADKIAVAVSGDSLPDNKNPEIQPIEEEPVIVEKEEVTQEDTKKENNQPPSTKNPKKVPRKVVPPKKRPALSNLNK
mgnify:CR=1 FL=1